jgi:hypothetical protein
LVSGEEKKGDSDKVTKDGKEAAPGNPAETRPDKVLNQDKTNSQVSVIQNFFIHQRCCEQVPYFIKYSVHTSIVRTLILQPFLGDYLDNSKPFLRYLPSMVRRQNFITISFVKKCTLYLIKYGKVECFSLAMELTSL